MLATVPNDVFDAARRRRCSSRRPPIEYFAALCLLLELDRQFSDYYWTNVADRELPFVGLIEHTNFVDPARYDGRRFLYVANYLEHGHELLGLDADALLERYLPGLRKVNPAFDPRGSRRWLHREPAAQPIVTVGYHAADPAAADAGRGPRPRQHHAGLSRGPRDQLRRPARRPGRGGRARVNALGDRRRRDVHRRGAGHGRTGWSPRRC